MSKTLVPAIFVCWRFFRKWT